MRKQIMFLILLVFTNCYANWGYWHDGAVATGDFKAFGTESVTVLNEELMIELYDNHAAVNVKYKMKNVGKKIKVSAGFPAIVVEEKYGEKTEDVTSYSIKVDGKIQEYFVKKGKSNKSYEYKGFMEATPEGEPAEDSPIINSWFVSSIPFDQNQVREVEIQYKAIYQYSGRGLSDDSENDPDIFRYLLSTGAVWKDSIKKGTVTIRVVGADPDKIIFKSPKKRFKRKDFNTYQWVFNNLEPKKSDDIIISMNNRYETKYNYGGGEGKGFSYYTFYKNYFYIDYKCKFKVSSELPSKRKTYAAENLTDNKIRSAWVEGKQGDGINEEIEIEVPKNALPNQIAIIPGYTRSYDLYYANNRIAEFDLFINGKKIKTFKLKDQLKPWHIVDFPEQKEISSMKVVIKKVYQGKKYKDTAISEIRVRKKFKEKPEVNGAR